MIIGLAQQRECEILLNISIIMKGINAKDNAMENRDGEDRLVTTAKRFEALRKILTNSIWIIIVIVVLAAIGRHLVARNENLPDSALDHKKPIAKSIPWHEVDKAIARAITDTRKSTEIYAAQQIDEWTAGLMSRVDNDFLEWYFSYWQQQVIGLKALGYWIIDTKWIERFIGEQPDTAERITEVIQDEFAKRVLRPEIAELEMERIVRDTANYYTAQLRDNLNEVPSSYMIPQADWDKYITGIAITTHGADGDREIPVSLKALTASGAGGAVVLAGKMKALVGKLSGKVMAKSAGKAASKMAAKTGGKVAAKAGGKFLGLIVGVGVLVWDVWDHHQTEKDNRPILRQAMADYFKELKDILMNDPEAGLMVTFNDLEGQIFAAIRQPTATE